MILEMTCFYEWPCLPEVLFESLPGDVTKEDLASLFIGFDSMDAPCVKDRIIDGRMRGQAFNSFQGIFFHYLNFNTNSLLWRLMIP